MRLLLTCLLAFSVVACNQQAAILLDTPQTRTAAPDARAPATSQTSNLTPKPPKISTPSATVPPPTRVAPAQTLPAPVASFAADPNNSHAMYALLVTNALYRTLDSGQTWQKLPLPAPEESFEPPAIRPNSVFIIPQQDIQLSALAPRYLVVRAHWTLFRSANRGETWQTIQDHVAAWTTDENAGQWIYAWREGEVPREQTGLYRSSDGGDTWEQVYAGFFPPFLKSETSFPNHEGMTSLLLDRNGVNALYAGTDFGIYRSLNGGKTWQEFNTGLPPNDRAYRWTPLLVGGDLPAPFALTETSPDGLDSHAVLTRLQHGAVSPDQDAWHVLDQEMFVKFRRSNQLGFNGIHTFVRDPVVNTRLYLGTAQGLFISDDAGETWRASEPWNVGAVYRIGVAPGDETRLYLWTDHGLVVSVIPAIVSPTPYPNPYGQLQEIASPDGKWTAVLDTRVGSLELKNRAGKVFPIFPPGSIASDVNWSPDSRRLFVARNNYWLDPQLQPQSGASLQIWQVQIPVDTPTTPTLSFESSGEPPELAIFDGWSPNQRYLLFWVGPDASGGTDGLGLWVLDVQNNKVTRLAESALMNPKYQSWAPDSSALAFTAGGYRSAQVSKWLTIFNTTTNQVATVVTMTEQIPGIVTWSPRGNLIAYAAVRAEDTGDEWADWMSFENKAILARRVYLLDPKTGKHWRLNTVDAFQDAPTWSDDGSVLYYVQRKGDDMLLMAANPANGQAQIVPGTRMPAPHAVGYYGQSNWDSLLAHIPTAPRAPLPALTEIYREPNGRYSLRYPNGWRLGQGWQYLIYGCAMCRIVSADEITTSPPNYAPFSGKAYLAIETFYDANANLDALQRDALAEAGPGQILDRGGVLTAFDSRDVMIDGKPARRFETLGEFGEINHVLIVWNDARVLILRGQGDGRVFDAVAHTLQLE